LFRVSIQLVLFCFDRSDGLLAREDFSVRRPGSSKSSRAAAGRIDRAAPAQTFQRLFVGRLCQFSVDVNPLARIGNVTEGM